VDVGVVLPVEQVIPELGPIQPYARVRALALKAEELGFHSVWTGDHLLFRRFEMTPAIEGTQGAWESWTILTALAEATSRIRLGPWVTATPLRNPAILAKMAATLDEVSGGRFILGLGSGWNRPTFDAFGVPFDHPVDRLTEALQIIVPLLRDGHVDFHGRYFTANDCAIVPRGPSPHGPPILIAAQRPRMLRLAARYADLWNRSTGYPTIPATREEFLAGMDEACAEVGRDPATLGLTVRLFMGFPKAGPMPPIFTEGSYINGKEGAAETLRAYAGLGASLAFVQMYPCNEAALEELAEAVELAHAAVPADGTLQ
jgi:alkanesulfonate monooxygenase SsuD/methylene tetrahydromethanopterin reductase-like flavin-dependent oxidoreductase (luciferase family)